MNARLSFTLALLVALCGCQSALRWESGQRGDKGTGLQGKAPPPPESRQASPSAAPYAPKTPVSQGEYRVQKGDTLFAVAFRNSLDYHELARWNGIGADYAIAVDQVLRLAPPRGAGDAPAAVSSAPAKTAVPSEANVPMPALPASFEWMWPTRGKVLRGYAPGDGSKGLDITGELGQPVFAAAPGRVVYSGNALKGYGELIIIKHDEVHLSAYGYNRKRYVVEGDVVTSGQPIGELGLGPENKPLLHFEIRDRGKPVNPSGYLPKDGA